MRWTHFSLIVAVAFVGSVAFAEHQNDANFYRGAAGVPAAPVEPNPSANGQSLRMFPRGAATTTKDGGGNPAPAPAPVTGRKGSAPQPS